LINTPPQPSHHPCSVPKSRFFQQPRIVNPGDSAKIRKADRIQITQDSGVHTPNGAVLIFVILISACKVNGSEAVVGI
jgi:hypothetical protein